MLVVKCMCFGGNHELLGWADLDRSRDNGVMNEDIRTMSTLSKLDPHVVRVAVIVPTYSAGRLETLRKCPTGILDNVRHPDEIIVVVDSNPSLFEFLDNEVHDSDVMVVLSDGSGVSAARNTGANKCDSEILVFIDDDVVPDRNWLGAMTETLCAESVAGAGGNILTDYEEGARQLPPELLWMLGCTYSGHPKGHVPITRPIGSTMAFRKDVFLAVGGFNSRFGPVGGRKSRSNEELVLSESIRQRCGPGAIRYQPEAIVYHRVPVSRTTLRFLVLRSWVEGTSKADVRSFYFAGVLQYDQQYLFGTMIPNMLRYLSSGSRSGMKAGFQLILVSGVTAVGFLTCRIKYLVRAHERLGSEKINGGM